MLQETTKFKENAYQPKSMYALMHALNKPFSSLQEFSNVISIKMHLCTCQ